MSKLNRYKRVNVHIRGIVQGVGFRPFVYRLANELQVKGWASNSSSGLIIEAESDEETLNVFLSKLQNERPLHSHIHHLEITSLNAIGYTNFAIRESRSEDAKTTLILPDIAVCDECLQEMNDPSNRRYRYPFINCTDCGPRFSIIESLPYDRSNTTMKIFVMCPDCEAEYHNPSDRRFHAQPIACPRCGPHIELWNNTGKILSSKHEALLETVQTLRDGKIIALKGLGGFQLLVDATNNDAVQRLRLRKHREEKPFALMFSNLSEAEKYCVVSDIEKQLLLSSESPILLLKRKNESQEVGLAIASSIAPRNPYLGVMLPYTPLHYLLMSEITFPIVATSGNISEEPMCIDEFDALKKLGSVADYFLVNNRPIHRYVDDSIVRVIAEREMIIRRARGFAPLPIRTNNSSAKNVELLAVGGHLKNTVAMQKGKNIFLSQHIGDLVTASALDCFKQTIDDFLNIYETKPSIVLHDTHPNYTSTLYANNNFGEKLGYQHHFAHVASCMADNGLDEPVLGISWDGTGYGLDGTIWGGEFIDFDGNDFTRVATMRQFSLPGGEKGIKEPIRSVLGILYEMYGKELFNHNILAGKFSKEEQQLYLQMFDKKINTPVTSSIGRIFDAVGALLGIRNISSFEGQTAMEVEFSAHGSTTSAWYPINYYDTDPLLPKFNWEPMFRRMLSDIQEKVEVAKISRKFHNTLGEIILSAARQFKRKKVVLSGGCFQNALLLERSVIRLREKGFIPFWHRQIPTNDGGISVGQIYMHHLINNS